MIVIRQSCFTNTSGIYLYLICRLTPTSHHPQAENPGVIKVNTSK